MQTAVSSGSAGFYSAILPGGVDRTTRTDVTASAVYAFVTAAFIQVPEFPQGTEALILIVGLSVVLVVIRKKEGN